MGPFILRRLAQAVFTVLGVMLLTFVLFRLVTGDVTAQFVNPKLGKEARLAWLRKNRLDRPMVLNLRRRLIFTDRSAGDGALAVGQVPGSRAAEALGLEKLTSAAVASRPFQLLSAKTPLADLTEGEAWLAGPKKHPAPASGPATRPDATAPRAALRFALRDGGELEIDLSDLSDRGGKGDRPSPSATCGDLMRRIHEHPENRGRLAVTVSAVSPGGLFDSQFFWHLWESMTFSNRSYKTNELLLDVIAKKARYSLAISVPLLALGWLLALVVSSVVAYYRGGLIDKVGVFVCVLGMCVPFLVYMIFGQKLIFEIAPTAAWGLHNPANIFVPIGIALIAGLGRSVRFYRTVILDQVGQDYVRTARAKGVPLYGILFRHVLKNCMLPILTSLVLSIPFLIMGSLLLERFFGVPGLGDLMVSSVSDRDVPIISGLTFLTAGIYVVGLLVTDLLYAVFDPRIRLR